MRFWIVEGLAGWSGFSKEIVTRMKKKLLPVGFRLSLGNKNVLFMLPNYPSFPRLNPLWVNKEERKFRQTEIFPQGRGSVWVYSLEL